MLTSGGLWLLLAACVAAYDSYDKAGRTGFEGGFSYYDDSMDLDPGQFKEKLPRGVMIFKLIGRGPNSDYDEWQLQDRPASRTEGNPIIDWPHGPNDRAFKYDAVKKRNPPIDANDMDIKLKPVIRQQPKWRIKRPPRLCLLKLCPYMYYKYE